MEWSLAIVALALLGVATISGRLTGTPVTPAMVFVAVGLLVGPKLLGELDFESSGATVRTLAKQRWFPILRLYSPLEPFFDKSWRPSEFEPA